MMIDGHDLQVSVDNFTFKLFYKWSVSLFIASSVTVISGQFFGDPIHCDIVRLLTVSLSLSSLDIVLVSRRGLEHRRRSRRGLREQLLLHVCQVQHAARLQGVLHQQKISLREDQPLQYLLPMGLSVLHDTG